MRADDATTATAWTPAVGRYDGLTLAVLGRREPRRTAAVRDAIVTGLHEGTIAASERRPSVPGVTLVGGGPGDPELISVAGRRALMEADVVVADRLAPRELLGDLPATTEVVDVAKLPRGRSARQEEINRLIVERALAGQRVARFKGGDSFVFGRGFEEIEACRAAGVAVHVIPGLSSPLAVPAVAGIPVTHRGVAHDFTVVSGHLPPGHDDSLVDWDAVGRLRGTLLLMMAVENAPHIATALQARRPPVGYAGRGRLRRVDAGGADRALDAGRAAAPTSTGTAYARRRSSWSATSSPSRIPTPSARSLDAGRRADARRSSDRPAVERSLGSHGTR